MLFIKFFFLAASVLPCGSIFHEEGREHCVLYNSNFFAKDEDDEDDDDVDDDDEDDDDEDANDDVVDFLSLTFLLQ